MVRASRWVGSAGRTGRAAATAGALALLVALASACSSEPDAGGEPEADATQGVVVLGEGGDDELGWKLTSEDSLACYAVWGGGNRQAACQEPDEIASLLVSGAIEADAYAVVGYVEADAAEVVLVFADGTTETVELVDFDAETHRGFGGVTTAAAVLERVEARDGDGEVLAETEPRFLPAPTD